MTAISWVGELHFSHFDDETRADAVAGGARPLRGRYRSPNTFSFSQDGRKTRSRFRGFPDTSVYNELQRTLLCFTEVERM